MMASPENVVIHGQHLMYWRPSLRMLPQLGVGGGMPSPEEMQKLAQQMPGGLPPMPGAPGAPGLPPTMPGLPGLGPKLPGGPLLPGLGGKPSGIPGFPGLGKKK